MASASCRSWWEELAANTAIRKLVVVVVEGGFWASSSLRPRRRGARRTFVTRRSIPSPPSAGACVSASATGRAGAMSPGCRIGRDQGGWVGLAGWKRVRSRSHALAIRRWRLGSLECLEELMMMLGAMSSLLVAWSGSAVWQFGLPLRSLLT